MTRALTGHLSPRFRTVESTLGILTVLVLVACSSSKVAEPMVPKEQLVSGGDGRNSEVLRSRCSYEGRTDRVALEMAGPGAVQPNIRRVYALNVDGDEKRRVLICREVDTNFDGVKDVVRLYSDRGEPESESVDSDFDGKLDTWMTYTRGRLVKAEVDTNGDGRPDEERFYLRGRLRRVQRDTNHDGSTDVWEIYDAGRLQRMGEDLDYDGHVDRWNRDQIALRQAEALDREEERRRDSEQKVPSAEIGDSAKTKRVGADTGKYGRESAGNK